MAERQRARKGAGSIDRYHQASKGCPPVGPDGARPEHPCRALYRARITVKSSFGEPSRKVLYGKTEAEVAGKLRKAITSEGNGHVVAKSATVTEWFDRWMASDIEKSKARNTVIAYRQWLDLHIKPHVGHHRLDRLRPEHVTALHDALWDKGLSDATVHGVHAVLRRGLRMAMRAGLVARNVADADHVEQPKQNSTSNKPLSVQNAWRLLDAAGEDPRWVLALMAALRRSEALALRWMDLCLDGTEEVPYPHLVVRRNRTYVPGQGYFFERAEDQRGAKRNTKSDAGQDRIVPLIDTVRDSLVALHERRRRAFFKVAADDLVFVSSRGNTIDPSSDMDSWKALLDRAGVPFVKPHSARNTTAALLESAGVPPRVVAAIIGHSDVAMTYLYQDGNADALEAAREAFDNYMRTSRTA